MKTISDDVLLTMAQIAATLIGLLLVAVLFYVETGLRRLESLGPSLGVFIRAFTKLILLLYSLVLGLSLGLVALERAWLTALYVLLGVAVVAALLDVTRASRDLPGPIRVQHGQVWIAWPPILVTLAAPWALDGADPSREAYAWTLILGGGLAFVLTASLLLLTFHLAALEQATQDEGE